MPADGLLSELRKVKLLGKYSAAKSFLITTSEEQASDDQPSFLPTSSKEQISLKSRKKKHLILFLSHISSMPRPFLPTQIYFLIKSTTNSVMKLKA